MTKKKRDIFDQLSEPELRSYARKLNEEITSLRNAIYRIESQLHERDRSFTDYRDRVAEVNDALRSEVRSLMSMLAPTRVCNSQEDYSRGVDASISVSFDEVESPDVVMVLRDMTRGIMRDFLSNGKFITEKSIASLVRQNIVDLVREVARDEIGVDRYGEMKRDGKSHIVKMVREKIEKTARTMLVDKKVEQAVDSAVEKAIKSFLSEQTEEEIVRYAHDRFRQTFNDALMRQISSGARDLANRMMAEAFERAVQEELPFLRKYESMLRLGLEQTDSSEDPEF